MKWSKFTIETTVAAEDIISELLGEMGIEGIEIQDNVPLSEEETKGMFIDILPELPPDDGSAKVSFYLDEEFDVPKTLAAVKEMLAQLQQKMDAGSCEITASETEDKDWINNWKQYFKPFTVDNILIKPTWEEVPEEHKDKMLIQIDPGTAFGTGMHETTQLCIHGLQKYLKPGDTLLDVGTGSGILSICGLKLGASKALGTDLDENAIIAVTDNMLANGISEEQFHVLWGNLIDDPKIKDETGYACWDIAVANILADVIIPLQAVIAPHIKKGSIFITSGIIDAKEEAVVNAFEANPAFEIVEVAHQGDWVSVVARKR